MSQRVPGPIGTEPAVAGLIDDGTMCRVRSAAPGPIYADRLVGAMPLEDRFIQMLERTVPHLPGEFREEFAQLIAPESVAIMAGTMAVWAGSHYFGVGFVADAILIGLGAAFLGAQAYSAAADLCAAISLTASANTQADLDEAARHLANFIAVVGTAVFLALVFRGAKKGAAKSRASAAGATTAAAASPGGLAPAHVRVFQQVARETKRIIAVRNTNPKSTSWIERGFPPKPMEIKVKTSPSTGIVTATDAADVQAARKHGFFVVDADGVPRNAVGEELKFSTSPNWPLEPGQVIHPRQQKPLVGDYDLLGVINPEAQGRNLVLAASDGKTLDDWSNPEIKKIASALNSQMDQPRVMHGAQDGFSTLPDKGGSVVFFPDGSTRMLNTPEDVAAFYREIGRQTITGSYR